MKKYFMKGICVTLSMVLLSSQIAFAAQYDDISTTINFTQVSDIEENYHSKSNSYTYVDLGTVTKEFSSTEFINSVDVLSRVLTLGTGIPAKIARSAAVSLFRKIARSKNPLYYTSKIHTTQVLLDGQFSHYIIEDETFVYSDERRTKLVAHTTVKGESLYPASIVEEKETVLS